MSAEAESGWYLADQYSDPNRSTADLRETYGFDLDLTYTDEREKLGESHDNGSAIVETISNYGASDCLLVAHYARHRPLVDRWQKRRSG